MNLGLKDIAFAKGRFALMAGVIALITMLLVMLTGLTSGLGNQSISAIKNLPTQNIVFATADEEKPSFSGQQITNDQFDQYREVLGASVAPLGINSARAQGLIDGKTQTSTNIAVFGGVAGPLGLNQAEGTVLVDTETARELGILEDNDHVANNASVSISGVDFTIAGIMDAQWYSHQPVVWVTHQDWKKLSRTPDGVIGSVLTIQGEHNKQQISELADKTETTLLSPSKAVSALAAYTSENGSLTMMQAFLYGISGLVIAAFVAIWTVQRTRDIAVLKALGASNKYVLKDSLSQALVVTVAGSVIGGLAGTGLALAASSVVPIQVTALIIAGPILGIVAIGVIASLLAVRQTTKINPLLALGGN